jgi:hypothetical protein
VGLSCGLPLTLLLGLLVAPWACYGATTCMVHGGVRLARCVACGLDYASCSICG